MSDLRENELLIEREFDAPVALVFRLWESRDHMLRWWGPEKFTAIELDWELTPGRPWRGAMTSKERSRVTAGLAAVPDDEERLVLATGRHRLGGRILCSSPRPAATRS